MNTHFSSKRPVILSFSGHDPSGGAGIQADIETSLSHHCHGLSVITALTEQDSRTVKKLMPQPPQDIIDQARTLFADFPVAAIKIGLLGHHATALAIRSVLLENPGIPVILDPVLAAGGGTPLAGEQLIDTIVNQLLPLTTVITPNSLEARSLTRQQTLADCGARLLTLGARFALITGTHERSTHVENHLFSCENHREIFTWERLPETYHGSGCTLASSIAALMAHGLEPFTAISEAQEYTWNALHAGYQPGHGQFNPDRLFWVDHST